MAYNGKVALVTGGGSGMGQLACRNFARSGARVAALDINGLGLAKTAEGMDNISTYQVDVTDFDALRAVVDEVEKELGPIDRVYSCAAIMPFGKLLELAPNTQHQIMNVNFNGLVNTANATLPAMLQRGKGDFVSFASMAGLMPTLLTGAYSASKAAVDFYNQTLYHENRNRGVRFASVNPPLTDTPLLEQGKDAWPKMIDQEGEAISPQQVLDAIEKALDKGEFMVFVRKRERFGWLVGRLFPNRLWEYVHKVEGW